LLVNALRFKVDSKNARLAQDEIDDFGRPRPCVGDAMQASFESRALCRPRGDYVGSTV
jgi:hypothetical protein